MRHRGKRALLAAGLWLGLGFFAGAGPALSAERMVTLDVKMSCPSCPFIVKRTLQGVAGVSDVAVSYEEQTATVRFDDDKTTVAALTRATAEVGFPSTPKPPPQ